MGGAVITATDATGKTAKTTTSADGKYSLGLAGFTAPVAVTATLPSGGAVKVYRALLDSLPTEGSVNANVTPLTDAVAALTSGTADAGAFTKDLIRLKQLDSAKLAAANNLLKTVLGNVTTELGVASDFDPLKTPFDADRTSGADKLLETVKVTTTELGITLTNVRVSVSSGSDVVSVTIAPDATQAPTALPKPTITTDYKPLDSWVSQLNQCLAMAPVSRVSVDTSGEPTALQGDCAKISGFSSSYLRNGYSLLQRWGKVLLALPQGAQAQLPETVGFFKSDAGRDQIFFRVAVNTAKGGTSYEEVAEKDDSGQWHVVGNQLPFDASISVRVVRVDDVSTNPWVPFAGPDKGLKVGTFSRYESTMSLNFNQAGPNAAEVYAVRVTGPGLRSGGYVMARSSSCGTGDYLAYYSDNGSLPPATLSMPSGTASSTWHLTAKPIGTGYTGTDFYNELRGRNLDGTPLAHSNYAPVPVDLSTIPDLANYTWEVFTVASGATPSATFRTRLSTRPVGPDHGDKLPWATASAKSLEYTDPTVTSKAGALSSVILSWTVSPDMPVVYAAYVFGDSRGASGPLRGINVGGPVPEFGATTATYFAAAETNGLGQACTTTAIPSFSATTGYREMGMRQLTDKSLGLYQITQHLPRHVPL